MSDQHLSYLISLTSCSNKSYTLPFENRKNIAAIALSPDANVLVSVDEGVRELPFFQAQVLKDVLDGRALLVNFRRGVVLHHFNFKKTVKDIKFSPDGACVF